MTYSLQRLRRVAFLTVTYGLLAGLSLWLAYELRFWSLTAGAAESEGTASYLYGQRPGALGWVIPLKLACLALAGQFRGIFYYFRLPDALRLGLALFATLVVMIIVPTLVGGGSPENIFAVPGSVTLIDANVSLVLFMGFRVSIRALRERFTGGERAPKGIVERVAIAGAGQAGARLAAELVNTRGHGIEPVCFLDDDESMHGLHIHGIPVIGTAARIPELAEKYGVTEIVLALPVDSVRRIREIGALATAQQLRVKIVPSMAEMAGGRVRASDIRPISVEDILGRPPTRLDDAAIDSLVSGRTILVTGAGGSIGLELCRQLIARAPAGLVILDQCEVLLYQAEQELISLGAGARLTSVVGDVADADAMREVFARLRPSLVFHAAAHKHVPLMEAQPSEALKNNVLGTGVVSALAAEFGVEKFVLISSDKAVNPTNVMGATKRLAEKVVKARQILSAGRTSFIAVRFGNVLGSSGSVIPIFRRQIAAGGPVTVTHPEVSRYFMTIPEAVGLVLQSASLGEGGDILVLEMGQPLKIIEVARHLIELSGLRPDIDIEIRIIGLRPGEKLTEELQLEGEAYRPTAHARIYRFVAEVAPPETPDFLLDQVRALLRLERQACKQGIRKLVPEYVPFTE